MHIHAISAVAVNTALATYYMMYSFCQKCRKIFIRTLLACDTEKNFIVLSQLLSTNVMDFFFFLLHNRHPFIADISHVQTLEYNLQENGTSCAIFHPTTMRDIINNIL